MKPAPPFNIEQVPDKAYFKIGEVAKIVAVQTHVLRYWETEFPLIKPNRIRSRQRLYRRKDVISLLHIRRLLYDDGYTIAGARQLMAQGGKKIRQDPADKPDKKRSSKLRQVKQELLAIQHFLSGK